MKSRVSNNLTLQIRVTSTGTRRVGLIAKIVIGGRPYTVQDENEAKLKAKHVSKKVVGVVAFSQMVDADAADAERSILFVRSRSV